MSVVTVQSNVEVANIALDKVKEAPILDFGENRAAAKWMSRNFDATRNLVMTLQAWKFTLKRAELPEDAQPPLFDWNHRYRKPEDCLRVLMLRGPGAVRGQGKMNGPLIPHAVEGDFILCDHGPPLKIRYISLQTNPATWPAPFVDALACKLAANIAHTLSGKMSMVEVNEQRFQTALQTALLMDAAEATHAAQYATEYQDARYYHYDTPPRAGY